MKIKFNIAHSLDIVIHTINEQIRNHVTVDAELGTYRLEVQRRGGYAKARLLVFEGTADCGWYYRLLGISRALFEIGQMHPHSQVAIDDVYMTEANPSDADLSLHETAACIEFTIKTES
tara:strand:- start:2548 stop:2904 length:357 start_codon:yes stop_codon:yes gene_type:complete